MADKKVVRYKLVKHKWPDELLAEKQRRKRRIAIVLACIFCFAGGFIVNMLTGTKAAGNNEDTKKITEIYSLMKDKFYFGKGDKKFPEKLISGAIDGMVNAGGDRHTMYLDPKLSQNFTSSMEGSFVGIGVQYYAIDDETFIVDKVLKDSPAEEAGILAGDRIYAIAGKVCKNMNVDDVKNLIVGSEGSKVEIELIRENKHIKKQVERRTVLDSVYSETKGNTAILKLNSFAETSGKEVENHLKSIQKKNCKNLVIDLRDNGGGYLQAAQEISSMLLPQDTVIFKEENKAGDIEEYKTLKGYTQYTFHNIVVVVNQDTASAAEVLTATLKEHLNAKVVGVKTYGKGTVQIPLTFKDGSMFKYTVAQWLTPKGNKINGKGITPDVEVKLDPALTTSAPKLEEKEVYKADTVNIASKSVQTYLKFLGYAVDRSDEYFSVASSNALKQYQKDKGLAVTGDINSEVISSLLSSCSLKWHVDEDLYDTQMQKAVKLANGK